MEIENRGIEKKLSQKRYLPWLDPSYLPVNFRGTFRNISYLRKDFTTVEDDEERHELVMLAVAQQMNLLTALFMREINRGFWCKVRSREFWRTCRANWDNVDYLNNIRVDSKTFWYLVEKHRPFLERQKTNIATGTSGGGRDNSHSIMALRRW